jgi:hypothetical protein
MVSLRLDDTRLRMHRKDPFELCYSLDIWSWAVKLTVTTNMTLKLGASDLAVIVWWVTMIGCSGLTRLRSAGLRL